MNKFYPQGVVTFEPGVRATFVSRRLVDLILRKTAKFQWKYMYFEVKETIKFGAFRGKVIGTNGMILIIEDQEA